MPYFFLTLHFPSLVHAQHVLSPVKASISWQTAPVCDSSVWVWLPPPGFFPSFEGGFLEPTSDMTNVDQNLLYGLRIVSANISLDE
jgi:hypothetical protein